MYKESFRSRSHAQPVKPGGEWSSDEDDENDDKESGDENNLIFTSPLTIEQSTESLSIWTQSMTVIVFHIRTAFPNRQAESIFLDSLARRTIPLAYLRIEHFFPFRWHSPNDFFNSLALIDVNRLVLSNLHFPKDLPIPYMIHAKRLEIRDCWFDDGHILPSECHVESLRISGGFGVASHPAALSDVLDVAKQQHVTDFGYVVDHWERSVSSSLLKWIQSYPHFKHLELGTDVMACFTQSQWVQWMTALTKCSLQTLTFHVGRRFDKERAELLRESLRQNRCILQVDFVGCSQHLWMQSIDSVCKWNRFANGLAKLAVDIDHGSMLQVIAQQSQLSVRRLAFLFSEHTDTLCHWVHNRPIASKRKRSDLKSDSIAVWS
jgi:hypothetical protein